jgi:DNA-directed RNA polymerase subunit alpha
MEFAHLSNTVGIKTISEDAKEGVFEIEGLYAGYGLTVGNALRRTLLSSLPGAAITYIKVKGVSHEFSTLPGMKEDAVEIVLNLKKIRLQMDSDEPQVLRLYKKGEGEITAGDIETNANVKVVNPEEVIANLTSKDAEFDAEVTVERGLGYSAVESRKSEKLAIGVVAIDAFFSPVLSVNYHVENMRVGDRTDYNRLRVEIKTDGTVSPSAALHKSANVLRDHYEKVGAVEVKTFESESPAKKKGKTKKNEASEED